MPIIAIPVRAYAIVADEAAFLLSERVGDIFDCSAPSRARLVALASMIELYPSASRAHLARNFGYGEEAGRVSTDLARARHRNWWRPADIDHVVKIAREALGLRKPEWRRPIEETDHAPASERTSPAEKAPQAARFTPRKAVAAPARAAYRRVSVTGALLGDPTDAQRAAMAAKPGFINAGAMFTHGEAKLRRKNNVAENGL
jgi:hypothetical protein